MVVCSSMPIVETDTDNMIKHFLGGASLLAASIAFAPYIASADPLQCLDNPSGASESFGYGIAATDGLILAGDPGANTVWAYERKSQGGWELGAIRPPRNSQVADLGRGFGRSVAIDRDGGIVIGAYIEEAMGVTERKEPGDGFRRLGEIFVAEDISITPEKVPGLDSLTKTQALGFSVTRTQTDIALGLRTIRGENYGRTSVLLVDLEEGSQKRIQPTVNESQVGFGYSLDSANGLVAISASWLEPAGGGVIYDIESHSRTVITPPKGMERTGFSIATDGDEVVLGGSSTVTAHQSDGKWAVDYTLPQINGVVAIAGDQTLTLKQPARAVELGYDVNTAPLDLTLSNGEQSETVRLADRGRYAERHWSRRDLAAFGDSAVISRVTEVEDCNVSIVNLSNLDSGG